MEQNRNSDKAESKNNMIWEAEGFKELRSVNEDSDSRAWKSTCNKHDERNATDDLVDAVWVDCIAEWRFQDLIDKRA